MEKVYIDVRPDGTLQVGVTGVKGADCEKLTRGIQAQLGVEVSKVRTSEHFETPPVLRKAGA